MRFFGRPFVKHFAVCYRTVACLSVCPVQSVLSVLSVTLVCCGQTVGRIKMKLGLQVGLSPGHIVLDGDPGPPLCLHQSARALPIFGPYLWWPNWSMDQDATWWEGSPSDIVLDADPALPSPKRMHSPQFLAHVHHAQMAE